VGLLVLIAQLVPWVGHATGAVAAPGDTVALTYWADPWVEVTGITTGPDGNLWLTERFPGVIARRKADGSVTTFQLPTPRSYPGQIISGPDGNLWFTENAVDRIGRSTTSGIVTEFPLPAGHHFPQGPLVHWLAAGSDGNLWFVEAGAVGRITPAGAITEFGLPAGMNVYAITAAPDGTLWGAGSSGSSAVLVRITTSGAMTPFAQSSVWTVAEDVIAGPDGALWATVLRPATPQLDLVRIDLTGHLLNEFDSTHDEMIGGLNSGPDGAVWYQDGGWVGRITPAGQRVKFGVPPTHDAFEGTSGGMVANGPDGNVWFSGLGNFLGRIALTPQATTTDLTESATTTKMGQPVTLTATVKPPFGSGTPTGSVQFFDRNGNLGGPVPLSGGKASLVLDLVAGRHDFRASYSGDGTFFTSLSPGMVTLITTATAVLTAYPAVLQVGLGGTNLLTMKAKLTAAENGKPLPGHPLTFVIATSPGIICNGFTDINGVAACSVGTTELQALLQAGGYDVYFKAEYAIPNAASAHGTLIG
jgi:virginiamycin B lyase